MVKGLSGEVLLNSPAKLRGRGNSTWLMDKKPYRLKLNKSESLLGMPSSKTLVLLANYADKSLLRNELAFEVSRMFEMAFTPQSRYIDLFLNGSCIGNYLLTASIAEGKDKVDVVPPKMPMNGIGGYLLEVTGYNQNDPIIFKTGFDVNIAIKYPDEKEITSEQIAYIKSHYQKFENVISVQNVQDMELRYQQLLDVNSIIDFYLINEILANPDLFWSIYMYKKYDDDKLYTGPIWDFDIAANNDTNVGDVVNTLAYNFALRYATNNWFSRLMTLPSFRSKIKERWNLRKARIETLPSLVDQLAVKLKFSQNQNFQRWDILEKRVYRELQIGGSYSAETALLKTFLTKRIAWLNKEFNSSYYSQ
ncbi:hypothetical protein DU508_05545 [Pedobacter chinensis]|uniref:Spore coat protein CotH n=1 Tax=Pedobacter chinensis TaxID=2282421 RepID=A0A369PVZ7_9SPHI|nr:CotH kinase family protein [Pedobacter chinensis]RDC56674.1 hypothetical protein DU508_05545 [Pedobacter chinensis]